MNFTLLNPFLLMGLAATILPILIHRITRKKVSEKRFSAVHLLLQSQRIAARPQRLKNLLLLALRILAVALIVLLMARPVLVRTGFASLLKGGAKVLILDNSLSMGYLEDRGQRYEVAKAAAKEALKGFGGLVSLVPTVTGDFKTAQESPWMKPEEILSELEKVPLTHGRGNTTSAFKTAYQMLKDLKVPKQILILSDLARGDWDGLDLTRFGNINDAEIIFLRMGGPARDPNVSVKDVRLVEEEIVVGVPGRLEVTVSNFSDRTSKTLVQLNLAGLKVDQKSLELNAGQDRSMFFELLVEDPGWITGEIKLSSDHLNIDDVFYFPLNVKDKVRVLVVDGDPKTSLRGSESYFLVSALHPGGLEGSPFLTRVVTEGEMDKLDPRSYDILFLLNVSRPDLSRLASFLEMEKPVFIFLGDRIVPEAYNQFPFAPWQIGERIERHEQEDKMTRIDTNQAASHFINALQNSLKSTSVRVYFKLEGSGKNLLTLENQDPLFMEGTVGKAKLYMFSSSADLAWNDLALNAAYVPLIQGLVKNAVQLSGTGLPKGLTVGEPIGEGVQTIQIKGPRNGPGIFQLNHPSGEIIRGVNVPHEESNLSKITENELQKTFGTLDVRVAEYKEGGLNEFQGGRRELWPVLLILLFFVLTFEMILANSLPVLKNVKPVRQDVQD